jgi:hypothetical protein
MASRALQTREVVVDFVPATSMTSSFVLTGFPSGSLASCQVKSYQYDPVAVPPTLTDLGAFVELALSYKRISKDIHYVSSSASEVFSTTNRGGIYLPTGCVNSGVSGLTIIESASMQRYELLNTEAIHNLNLRDTPRFSLTLHDPSGLFDAANWARIRLVLLFTFIDWARPMPTLSNSTDAR